MRQVIGGLASEPGGTGLEFLVSRTQCPSFDDVLVGLKVKEAVSLCRIHLSVDREQIVRSFMQGGRFASEGRGDR